MSDLDNEQNPVNWLVNQPIDAKEIGSDVYVPERPIRETILLMVKEANKDVPEERQVLGATAIELVERSLLKTYALPDIEQRVSIATRELQDFLSTAITGRKPVIASAYTDLLPIGHPLSTNPVEVSSVTRALLESEWLAADPRISEEFRPLVASVYLTSPGSVEYNYLMSRLESADDKDIPRDVVIAVTAAINPFAGGNSFLERSARAKLQRRDRLGRFAFMGGGARTFIRNLKGFIQSCVGRFVGSDPSSDTFDVEFIDDPVLGTGIYRFPSSKVSGVKAFLQNLKGLLTSRSKPKSAD